LIVQERSGWPNWSTDPGIDVKAVSPASWRHDFSLSAVNAQAVSIPPGEGIRILRAKKEATNSADLVHGRWLHRAQSRVQSFTRFSNSSMKVPGVPFDRIQSMWTR
jgi:hypothetical protein